MFTMFGAAFLVLSNLAVVIVLPLVAPVHQSAEFVFSRFYSADTSTQGIPNDACAAAPAPMHLLPVKHDSARLPAVPSFGLHRPSWGACMAQCIITLCTWSSAAHHLQCMRFPDSLPGQLTECVLSIESESHFPVLAGTCS